VVHLSNLEYIAQNLKFPIDELTLEAREIYGQMDLTNIVVNRSDFKAQDPRRAMIEAELLLMHLFHSCPPGLVCRHDQYYTVISHYSLLLRILQDVHYSLFKNSRKLFKNLILANDPENLKGCSLPRFGSLDIDDTKKTRNFLL